MAFCISAILASSRVSPKNQSNTQRVLTGGHGANVLFAGVIGDVELDLGALHPVDDGVAHDAEVLGLHCLSDHGDLHDQVLDLVLHGSPLGGRLARQLLLPQLLPINVVPYVLKSLLGLLC